MLVDLHTHSYFSPDGSATPEQGVGAAWRAGVRLLAMTDHDTAAHIEPFLAAAAQADDLHVIPGIELSCAVHALAIPEIHVLCYFPDKASKAWRSTAMTSVLKRIRHAHEGWVQLVSQEAGLPLHQVHTAQLRLAEACVIHPSAVPSLQAVKRYALTDAPGLWTALAAARAHIRAAGNLTGHPDFPDITDISCDLRALGAILTLAHPTRFGWLNKRMEEVVKYLRAQGVERIEAGYGPMADNTRSMLDLAHRFSLGITVGSDVHDLLNAPMQTYADGLSRLLNECGLDFLAGIHYL